MNKKEFFKPTIPKIIILILLIIISTIISPKQTSCQPTSYGFPLKFFQFKECFDISPCIETTEPGPHIACEHMGFIDYEIYPDITGITAFIINIIFWYLVSSIIMALYKNLK